MQIYKRMSNILTKVSLGVNIVCIIHFLFNKISKNFIFLGFIYIKNCWCCFSKSLSVVSSVIDSAVDLATSVILFWAWRAIKKRDKYRYPQGILAASYYE